MVSHFKIFIYYNSINSNKLDNSIFRISVKFLKLKFLKKSKKLKNSLGVILIKKKIFLKKNSEINLLLKRILKIELWNP